MSDFRLSTGGRATHRNPVIIIEYRFRRSRDTEYRPSLGLSALSWMQGLHARLKLVAVRGC